jgi:hypothetical protein
MSKFFATLAIVGGVLAFAAHQAGNLALPSWVNVVPALQTRVDQDAADYGAGNGGAALRMIKATGLGLALQGRGRDAKREVRDGWKYSGANGLAAALAAHGVLPVPEFLWNRRGARRAGDRVGGHYLE